MRIWDLTHLSLSYKSKFKFSRLNKSIDIVEIDNLKGMERLTKLQLDNNVIVQIKNLDHLVNLQWLDLSFNLITKIENLDKCVHLTDLSLFKNHIVKLEGLESLNKLNVLSVGSNKLENLEDTIEYLMKLKNNLQVLRIDGNKFTKTRSAEYKKFTIARLKNLQYIDYELIEQRERDLAYDEHKDELGHAAEAEGDAANEDSNQGLMNDLRDAKIEITADIFGAATSKLDEE